MHFSTGPSRNSWQPKMGPDTTDPSYWFNWRFLLCSLCVLFSMVIASILIWKYEGSDLEEAERQEAPNGTLGSLYDHESWRPCIKSIHPVWLLVFRIVAFLIFVVLLIINILVDGASMMYYYTQWTFVLVTIYFGLGSLLSAYGCHQFRNEVAGARIDRVRCAEHGTYVPPRYGETENSPEFAKNCVFQENPNNKKVAGFGSYLFQIVYQTNAGAVMLTDFVFWLIIYPFLAKNDYELDFIQIGVHSLNAPFLLFDTAMNSLRFPWFRIAYFLLWTSFYVIFQWVIHASISIWWPYPFLDLSSSYAPIWYLSVAVLHVPCYAVFPLIMKLKHSLLIRCFPSSYYPAQ
ncbi:hypothetical protein AXF42_Ash003808 [Apostasia shenzhenica]|uniref:Uncharacterized protein n=1 Tax=Apostasia shenzhenica TaxID=1088818 RepID=A0A2I0AI05_9ASPA|nr:hypothetical protein AXF42_Ash003808 [Apostasia shenzhenica]